jgi:hypothetical protein
VDEITLAPVPDGDAFPEGWHARAGTGRRSRRPLVLDWSARDVPKPIADRARVIRESDANALMERLAVECEATELPAVDAVLVDGADGVDRALRPWPGAETSVVRPRGEIWIRPGGVASPIADAVARRGLRLSTSRCGRFEPALELLSSDPRLCERLGGLVTHQFPAGQLAEALATARSPGAIKTVVVHAGVEADA